MGDTSFLLFTEEDNSYIIVDTQELVGVPEDVQCHDNVSYMYKNRRWLGEVIDKSNDRDKLEELMKQLGMKSKRTQAPARLVSSVVPSDILGKRRSHPVIKFGQPSTSSNQPVTKKPKRLSEPERRQLDVEKKKGDRAKKKRDSEILNMLVSPRENEIHFNDEDSDDSDLNVRISCNRKAVTAEKQELVKGIKCLQPGRSNQANLQPAKPAQTSKFVSIESKKDQESTAKGPSVEELLQKIARMEALLKAKEVDNETQLQTTDNSGDSFIDFDDSNDPSGDGNDNDKTEDDKNEQVAHASTAVNVGSNSAANDDDTEFNLEDDDDQLVHQLRGNGPKMVAISSRTYCSKAALKEAHRGTSNIKHVVRRLITGVFIPSQLKNVTVSGYKYRPGSKANPDRPDCEPLHRAALKDIFGYAQALGREKGWKPIKVEVLRTVVSHRLVEIKGAVRDGKLKDS